MKAAGLQFGSVLRAVDRSVGRIGQLAALIDNNWRPEHRQHTKERNHDNHVYIT